MAAARIALVAVLALAAAQLAVPAAHAPVPPALAAAPGFKLLGVNLASAEFGIQNMEDGGTNPGTYGRDYIYPTRAEIQDYANAGLNVVRLPFSWERMQPVMGGPLAAQELGRLDDLVTFAARCGVQVLLDPHNYGFGWGHPVGSPQTPDSAFADFWRRMADHYRDQPNVLFGLMNEPHLQTPMQWLRSVNAAIAAIRIVGARQTIFVPGTFHENGAAWVRQGTSVFADAVQDPARNVVFEVHQYLDADQSGGSIVPAAPDIGPQRLADVTAWAEAAGHRLFLGEFGAGRDPDSLAAMRNQLAFMHAHSGAWLGGTIWGGGPWWPPGYAWATDAQDGEMSPQIRLLRSFAPAP